MSQFNHSAYWPTTDWIEQSSQAGGFRPSLLEQMHAHIQTHLPGLDALLIVRHGYLVFEAYYQGFHARSYHSISSVTKSMVGMLVGVALAQGSLPDLDQTMLSYFPEVAASEPDARKHAITLRHLLALQSGFDAKKLPERYWEDPVQLALARPMVKQPGGMFSYDSQGVDILSGILSRVTGRNAAQFADDTLFAKLGIWRDPAARHLWRNGANGPHVWHDDAEWDETSGLLWKIDPQGNNPGAFGAHMTAREMAKLGYLYLQRGWWDGESLIPENYILRSTQPQSSGGWPLHFPYGYLWWLPRFGPFAAYMASGRGGKLIVVMSELDMVIVTLASTAQALQDPLQETAIIDLIPHFILPALGAE